MYNFNKQINIQKKKNNRLHFQYSSKLNKHFIALQIEKINSK